jgi:hypothetical protein
MIVEGAIGGCILSVPYFQGVRNQFLREGLITSEVWIVVNWVLNFVAVRPFSGHSIPRYVIGIGARYVAVTFPL